MNIVLLESEDWLDETRVQLLGRRHQHLHKILKVKVGDTLRVGALGGMRGVARVMACDQESAELWVTLNAPPPPRHPLKVVLALPRPKMLRRVLRSCAEYGIAELHLINSYRVEKSFWQTPLLGKDRIDEALRAGLERSGDTILPKVVLHTRFRPFMEDQLNGIAGHAPIYCLHPGEHGPLPADTGLEATVLIGPEGGFIPFEVELAQQIGASLRHLGDRILSVDTAVNAALARELPGSN